MSLDLLFALVAAGCAAALALTAALRAGRSRSRWAFALGMAALAAENTCLALGVAAPDADTARRWQAWQGLALALSAAPWLAFSVSYARNGPAPRAARTNTLLALAVLVPLGLWLAQAARAGAGADTRLGPASLLFYFVVLLAAVLSLMQLERTFRAAVGTIRWRIKFMLLGVAALLVARVYTVSQVVVFRAAEAALDTLNSAALVVATPLIVRTLFRAGHFEVDVYPSQAVLQRSLTALIAGVYLLLVGGLANLAASFGGDSAFAVKAFILLVAVVSVAVFLQSDRAQLRLRRLVSRHFRRPAYDYRAVWQTFTVATAAKLEPVELARAVGAFVAEVFAALSVSVWLANERRDALVLGASTTAVPRDGTRDIGDAALLAALATAPDATDLDDAAPAWAAPFRAVHPQVFPHGGHRVCVPLLHRGEAMGALVVGDRVGGAPLDLQDVEMLRSIADHTAACLMNAQLSRQLLQARELEAFQAMAAFFVHDLKNAAATLSLMLQNLPRHFDNPEFRAEALRGVGKTVTHVNHVIARLGALRHELKVELAPGDLNAVVGAALAQLEPAAGLRLVRELAPLPPVALDREQLEKVFTNLLLNAREASAAGGEIRVSTAREGAHAVVVVADRGCGMSPEFVAHALFRPFQTTKQGGLGIGMFHSRMIVASHHGRIAVSSEPGRGTTFRIYLPLAEPAAPLAAPRAATTPAPLAETLPLYEPETAHR